MNTKKTVTYHFCSVAELIQNTHIAPFQRLELVEHSDAIYNSISLYYQTHNELFLPNTISLAKVANSTKCVVLDGQHRLKALIKLMNTYPETATLKTRTDIYEVQTLEDAREIYTLINSSKKVELYTGDIEPYVIPKIQKYFLSRFEKYCKKSINPQRLNINLETLAKKIQGYELVARTGVTEETTDTLIDHIKQLNQFYSEQSVQTLLSYGLKDTLVEDLKSGHHDGFYLGLYKRYEWIERICDYYRGIKFHEQDHRVSDQTIKTVRKSIPKRLREDVWKKRFTTLTGYCICCSREISFNDFDCGHVISVKDRGDNLLTNLEPVCRTCNLDMGTMNLNKYKMLFTT
jgi:hypothetical protein